MSLKQFWLFLAMATALCAVAEASTTTFIAQDKRIQGTMRRMGCTDRDPRWVIETMRRSGILDSEVDRLRPGVKVVVPDECGTGVAPPKGDARAWRSIVEEHSMRQRLRNLENQIAKLTIENQNLRDLLAKAESTITSLRQKPNEENNAVNTAQPSLIWWQVGCCVLFCACLIFILREIRRRKLVQAHQGDVHPLIQPPSVAPKQVVISFPPVGFSLWFHSRHVDFYDDSVYWVGCPICLTRLKPNKAEALTHLNKEHADLRIREIDPEEAEDLLGISEPEPVENLS